ncbi:glycoside hydrolase family 2 protein [Actinospica robiniae]|uniref:glycoside hydrolase family 2 protein n=1 Tax=Actinospica robiniae TaxID=304901 RepID=UPI00040AE9DC|nr:glycoside hydrolase family 2 [Actinospica robiniae]
MTDQARAFTRRRILTTGAAAFAATALPDVAHAAGGRPRPAGGTVLASLDGTWDFMPTTGTPSAPPASGAWSSIQVPAEWNMTAGNFDTSWGAYDLFDTPAAWDGVDVAWYRRSVTVPTEQRGSRIVLRFEAVNFEATVFWNGTQITKHSGGLLPFEADVTDQVSWGAANTLHVLVRSGNVAAKQSDGWHYPNGSWWGQTCWGIWQDVWVLARSATYVSDTFVTTSVSDKTISVTTTLANDGDTAATVRVEHEVTDNGAGILSAATQATVPAGGTATVTFTKPWSKPRLWSLDDPHLYQLTASLRPATGKPVTDSSSVRFGFREITVEGTDVLLNGEPVMLHGDAWHYMGSIENSRAYATAWFTLVKALGVNYLRLHAMPYPPVFYDVADEMGLLIVAESGIYGSSGNYALGADDFWANCADHLAARVIRDRNHPSVFAWSAENEMLAAFGQSWAAKVAALKPAVSALDTSRPIYFEGDGDPESAGDLESTHYPLEITTSGTAIPESAYILAPGQSRSNFWDRNKPMLISEFSSMYYATPAQVSAVGGPAVYADLDGLWSAHALIVGAQIEGFRYAGATGISPWNTVWYGMRPLPFNPAKEWLPLREPTGPKFPQVGRYAATLNPGFERDLPRWKPNPIHDAVARTMPQTAAIATDYRAHAFGGSTFTRDYAVYNEIGTQQQLTLTWTLKLHGGRGASGSQHVSPPADGHTVVTVNVPVPTVSRTTAGSLTVKLSGKGATTYEYEAPLTVYPKSVGARTNKAKLSAAVLEPSGSTATADALTALGVSVTTIADLTALPTGGQLLVLGEGANPEANAEEQAALVAFIQGGGRVLSFAQQAVPQLLPWPVIVSGSQQTIAHVVAPHHPVLADIGADDLRWWNTPNEQVTQNALVKPRYGAFVSLADVGPGLAGSALAEASYGTGTTVLCQFPVISALADEPIAALLLRNLVDYLAAGTGTGGTAGARVGVLSPAGSPVSTTLAAAAVDMSAVTTVDASGLDGIGILLLDASDSASVNAVAAASSAVGAWISAGGTLWVNGLTSSALGTLSATLPSGLTLTALDAAHQLGAVTTGESTITDGLSNADLDWVGSSDPLVTATVAGRGGTSAAESRGVDWTAFTKGTEQNKYQIAAESADGFVPASVLWERAVGSGRVVIDQLLWAGTMPLPPRTALAAGIAAGLGAAFTAGSGSGLLPTTGWTGFASPNNAAAGQGYDRDESTRWSSDALQSPGMYYGLDLGAVRTISRIVWDDAPATGDLPVGLEIQTSTDGVTYTTAMTIPNTATLSNAGVLTIPLQPALTTRYLKMVDTGSNPGAYMSLYELYLFGE